MVYTKTIIHLSVGESDGYLPRPLSTTIHLHFGEQLLIIHYFSMHERDFTSFFKNEQANYNLEFFCEDICSEMTTSKTVHYRGIYHGSHSLSNSPIISNYQYF